MVEIADVEMAYRLILGREPESAAAVQNLAASFATIGDMRTAFFNSTEFNQLTVGNQAAEVRPLTWPGIPIDVTVDPFDLKKMIEQVEQIWEGLGETELFWSVLTNDDFKNNNIEANKATFYDSGRWAMTRFEGALNRAGLDASAFRSCLEFGCGVGRLTVWLSQLFTNVIGCDISRPHLAAAKTALEDRGIENTTLLLTNSINAIAELPRFDAFFSLIVLQHNPPPVAAFILEQILDKLKPGGVAYFQIPTYIVGYGFNVRDYLAATAGAHAAEMEMHAIPQKDLFSLFARHGCTVMEVREDDWAGSQNIISNTFLLRKKRR